MLYNHYPVQLVGLCVNDAVINTKLPITGSADSKWCISDEHLIQNIHFLFHQPHLASTTSERKVIKKFKGGRLGAPMIMPRPCPPGSKKVSIETFIVCFCTTVGSFSRILKKTGELRLRRFVFVFIAAKIRQKIHWIFQILKDWDHKNMNISKLNV